MTPNEEICCLTHLCHKQCQVLDVLAESDNFQRVLLLVLHLVDHVQDLAVRQLRQPSVENTLMGDC